MDASPNGESVVFGWSEPIHLTYYGLSSSSDETLAVADSDWMSEPLFVTHYTIEPVTDEWAGFEPVIESSLISYYIDLHSGDILALSEPLSEPLLISYYELEPVDGTISAVLM